MIKDHGALAVVSSLVARAPIGLAVLGSSVTGLSGCTLIQRATSAPVYTVVDLGPDPIAALFDEAEWNAKGDASGTKYVPLGDPIVVSDDSVLDLGTGPGPASGPSGGGQPVKGVLIAPSGARAINDDGTVVGWARGPKGQTNPVFLTEPVPFQQAGFAWNEGMGLVFAGTHLTLEALNHKEEAVGVAGAESDSNEADPALPTQAAHVSWSNGLQTGLFPSTAVDDDRYRATAISEEGGILVSHLENGFWRALRYDDGIETDLTPEDHEARVHDANRNGVLVGAARIAGYWDFAKWVDGEPEYLGAQDLGVVLPPVEANAVNSNGTIVGNWGGRAARWRPETGLESLMAPVARAWDVNDHGQIVGNQENPKRAYLWSEGTTTLLKDLVDAPEWEFTVAYGINNRGEIVGEGVKNGVTRAFLLRRNPLLEPPAQGRLVVRLERALRSLIAGEINGIGKKFNNYSPLFASVSLGSTWIFELEVNGIVRSVGPLEVESEPQQVGNYFDAGMIEFNLNEVLFDYVFAPIPTSPIDYRFTAYSVDEGTSQTWESSFYPCEEATSDGSSLYCTGTQNPLEWGESGVSNLILLVPQTGTNAADGLHVRLSVSTTFEM